MQKQTYFVFGILIGIVLIIALTIQTAKGYTKFKFRIANHSNIVYTIEKLKSKPHLCIDIFGYAEKFDKNISKKTAKDVLFVKKWYQNYKIESKRISISFGNKGGTMERLYKFKEDGVYIRLSYQTTK